MDDQDLENYLRDIATRTARIDERTIYIESDISELKDDDTKQDKLIADLNRRVHRNTIVVNAAGFGIASATTAILAKIAGVLRF